MNDTPQSGCEQTAKSCPRPGNTGAYSRLGVDDGPNTLSTGGVDTLEISADIHWPQDRWDDLVGRLEEAQAKSERAAQDGGRVAMIQTDEGHGLTVSARGFGQGVRCRWAINYGAIKIGIVARRTFGESAPNARVIIGSVPLMVTGHEACVETVREIIRGLGGECVNLNVSRIDICADLTECPVEDFSRAYRTDCYIALAATSAEFRDERRSTGLTFGRGMVGRIYDKSHECKQSANPDKLQILVERRWGKMDRYADCTRVEFQLRSKNLRKVIGNDRSVENVFANLGTIAEWCTTDWLRFTDRTVDRANRNHSRANVSELWQRVCDAFAGWTGEPSRDLPPVHRTRCSADALVKQAVGCMAAAVAKVTDASESTVETIDNLVELLRERSKVLQLEITQRIKDKRFADRITASIGPPPDLSAVPF